MAASFEKWL